MFVVMDGIYSYVIIIIIHIFFRSNGQFMLYTCIYVIVIYACVLYSIVPMLPLRAQTTCVY